MFISFIMLFDISVFNIGFAKDQMGKSWQFAIQQRLNGTLHQMLSDLLARKYSRIVCVHAIFIHNWIDIFIACIDLLHALFNCKCSNRAPNIIQRQYSVRRLPVPSIQQMPNKHLGIYLDVFISSIKMSCRAHQHINVRVCAIGAVWGAHGQCACINDGTLYI